MNAKIIPFPNRQRGHMNFSEPLFWAALIAGAFFSCLGAWLLSWAVRLWP